MNKTTVAANSRKKGVSQFPTQTYNAPKSGGPIAASAYPKECAIPEIPAASRVVRVRRMNHIITKLNAKPVPMPNRITAGMMNCVRQPIISKRLNANVLPINQTNGVWRSEEHTSELQSLMRISYAVFCLKKKKG